MKKKEVQQNSSHSPSNFGELVRVVTNEHGKSLNWFSKQIESERSAVSKWRSLGISPTSILFVKSLYVMSELTGESLEDTLKRTHNALGITEWVKNRDL